MGESMRSITSFTVVWLNLGWVGVIQLSLLLFLQHYWAFPAFCFCFSVMFFFSLIFPIPKLTRSHTNFLLTNWLIGWKHKGLSNWGPQEKSLVNVWWSAIFKLNFSFVWITTCFWVVFFCKGEATKKKKFLLFDKMPSHITEKLNSFFV